MLLAHRQTIVLGSILQLEASDQPCGARAITATVRFAALRLRLLLCLPIFARFVLLPALLGLRLVSIFLSLVSRTSLERSVESAIGRRLSALTTGGAA